MTQDKDVYLRLRQTPLHVIDGQEREQFCTGIATWLAHSDAWIRSDVTERLATAVLFDTRAPAHDQLRRLDWLFQTILATSQTHADVLPAFLRNVRYQAPGKVLLPRLLDWLDQLEQAPPFGLDPNLPAGVRLLLNPVDADWTTLVTLLDHPSTWLRGCAALVLGEHFDDADAARRVELVTLTTHHELRRPGVAGPFWSSFHLSGDWADIDWPMDPVLWMMDLLERRRPPVPALQDMPSNDIEFFLHELCCLMPEMVDRMLAGGFLDLALETATEMRSPVSGMEQRLRLLAINEHPEVAARAQRHLDHYYAAPGASD